MRLHPGEEVCFEARRHGIVLARPFTRALAIGGVGVIMLVGGAAALVVGALALAALASFLAIRAAWRWERTHLIVTTEKLAVVRGNGRRRAATVPFHRLDVLDLQQSLPGRVLGYGTIVAGPLEIDGIARPTDVCRLLARLAA